MHLAHPVFGLVDRGAELAGDRVEVVDVEVDEPIRSRVSLVLGQEDPRVARLADGDEEREAVVEPMRPLDLESEAGIPGGARLGVADAQERDDVAHARTIVSCCPAGDPRRSARGNLSVPPSPPPRARVSSLTRARI